MDALRPPLVSVDPTTVAVGIAVFAATNVDDLLLLAAFFADARMPARAVVAGQFVGIAALTAASGTIALLALVVPPAWVALLGAVPLALGLRALWGLVRAHPTADPATHAGAAAPAVRPEAPRAAAQALAVAAVTIANGGDNLGVYVPLFSERPSAVPLLAATFLAMTGVWCLASRWLVRHPAVGPRLARVAHVLLPVVLIGVGVTILAGARGLLAG